MLARLWWKEARLFWPVWVFLTLAAAASQWMVLEYLDAKDARTGLLPVMALGWTCLYAFAVAAAAFAGERENKTQAFLDTLPVGRAVLWQSKASFAAATTLALAAVLVAYSMLGTDEWDAGNDVKKLSLGVGVVAVLLEVVGWGLLWSALLDNALAAAAFAVASMLVISPILRQEADFSERTAALSAPWRLLIAAATTAVSGLLITRGIGSGARRGTGRRLAVLLAETGSPMTRRRRRTRTTRLWPTITRSLVWETARLAWPLWWKLAIMGLVLPFVMDWYSSSGFYYSHPARSGMWISLNIGVGLIAGVAMFGRENRNRTDRFLAHHGASPGLVWLVKNAVWAVGLALIWLPILYFSALYFSAEVPKGGVRNEVVEGLTAFAGIIATFILAGQLAGMTIRREITAVVIAAGLALIMLMPQGMLLSFRMMPTLGFLAAPLVLFFVTWAWSGEWLIDQPGFRRWAKLGLLLAVPFTLVFAAYAGYRALSVDWMGMAPLRFHYPAYSMIAGSAENATVHYQKAAELDFEYRRKPPEPPEAEAQTAEILSELRKASMLPFSALGRDGHATLFTPQPDLPRLDLLLTTLSKSVRDRQAKGDLDGAWEDILVMFRAARQCPAAWPLLYQAGQGVERNALSLAMRWAADPRQTRERLRAANNAFRGLPPMPPPADVILTKARVFEQTLELPPATLKAQLESIVSEAFRGRRSSPEHLWATLATTPWEIVRARKAFKVLFAANAFNASIEPRLRNPKMPGYGGSSTPLNTTWEPDNYWWLQETTPMAQWLFPNFNPMIQNNDHNEVGRRALVQILAIRSWQIAHGGRLPETLAEIVPSELERLPNDPYATTATGLSNPSTGVPFDYRRAEEEYLPEIGRWDESRNHGSEEVFYKMSDYWVLSSVGSRIPGDTGPFLFPIAGPNAKPQKKPAKKEGEDNAGLPGMGAEMMGAGSPGAPPFLPK